MNRLAPSAERQRGSTLLVALVMLVLLTLTAFSAMRASTNNVQVVGNAQFREEAIAVAQKAIENVISNNSFQDVTPAAQNVDVNGDGTADYSVRFDNPEPRCISRKPTTSSDTNVPPVCFSDNKIKDSCVWAIWDITAEVTDLHGSETTIKIHQGVKTITGLQTKLLKCDPT